MICLPTQERGPFSWAQSSTTLCDHPTQNRSQICTMFSSNTLLFFSPWCRNFFCWPRLLISVTLDPGSIVSQSKPRFRCQQAVQEERQTTTKAYWFVRNNFFLLYNQVKAMCVCNLINASAYINQECLSTLDLRDGSGTSEASMGNRSHSVPGLDIQVSNRVDTLTCWLVTNVFSFILQ